MTFKVPSRQNVLLYSYGEVMDLFEAIDKRSCYRGTFNDTPVTREVLQLVIEAGIKAPSACNKQSPSFIGVDDPDLIKRIADVIQKPTCVTAKAMIVCVSDDRPVYGDISFYKEDCAAATENMLLALTSFGYSTVWLDGVLRRDGNAEKIGEILEIPSNKRVQILLPIGVAAEVSPRSTRLSFEQRASFNGWGKQV